MSDHFEARRDSPAQRRAMRAYIEALLDDLLPAMRLAARGCGYAIAVHGSLARDIDLVAIPWTAQAQKPEFLVERLCGVIAGVLGRAVRVGEWGERPHGRQAVTIITPGDAEVDLSIMPCMSAEDGTAADTFEQMVEGEDGWSDWVHPVPGYRMECCDCGLVHEMEFAVSTANQDARPELMQFNEGEDAETVITFRARRADAFPASQSPGEGGQSPRTPDAGAKDETKTHDH